MISRRGFFGALATAAVGACVKLHVPSTFIPERWMDYADVECLRYRGASLLFDQHAPTNAIYFLHGSHNGPHQISFDPTTMKASVLKL